MVRKTIVGLVKTNDDNLQNEGASAYERAVWLKAINEYGDDESELYQECINIIGGEPEHPDFSSYMTVGWVDHKSPIPEEDLLSMEVDILVKRLESYKDLGNFHEPGLEGLTKALRQVVKAGPVRYFMHLHKFAGLDLAYVYQVLEAYGELWVEKAQLPWDEIWQHLLGFCEIIIKQEEFWSAENSLERSHFVANRYWVVGSIARLIENGTKSDEHAFPVKCLEQAQSILLILLEKEIDQRNTSENRNTPLDLERVFGHDAANHHGLAAIDGNFTFQRREVLNQISIDPFVAHL